ncbi:MAG: YqaA family protein [Methylobacter sp.]|nr:YqaA family protein [Methylobacter sp.]MDP2098826.1 YqaA family protein [Methylobacter sp.]MDP2428114.1 YqaA family protein [Methylobacter sp.]MDP3054418.1 YqaA family protein [Methylobacter sp.]MDP3364327.1 YqaA family protein [Methylobacter sp.]
MQDYVFEIGGLFVSAFISSTIAPGGSEAVVAYLVATGHYQAVLIVVVATIGNTLGAMTTWGLGVLAAKKFPAATLLSANKQKALNTVREKGIWTLFFTWLPVVGDALCFAGGWLKLPFFQACLIILLGKLGRYAVIAWLFV